MRLPPLLLALGLLTQTALSNSPSHFTDCAQLTGRNATVIIPAGADTQIGGLALSAGDEVAVFTPDGTCAGAAIWSGTTLVIPTWERDVFDPSGPGLDPGDPLAFRVFQAASGIEYGADPAGVVVEYDGSFDSSGHFAADEIYLINSMSFPTGTDHTDEARFELGAPFPNPFSSSTTISYTLPTTERVRLEVYDMLGRRVAVLVDEPQAAGTYEHRFQPDAAMAPGLYVARLRTEHATAAVRMMLVR
jgi:hypothetical protein